MKALCKARVYSLGVPPHEVAIKTARDDLSVGAGRHPSNGVLVAGGELLHAGSLALLVHILPHLEVVGGSGTWEKTTNKPPNERLGRNHTGSIPLSVRTSSDLISFTEPTLT